MEQAIAVLEEVKESILNAYAAKTGLSRNRLAKMMDAETWLNANEAMRLGFVDGILFAEDDPDKKPEEEPPEEESEENPDEPEEEPEEEPDKEKEPPAQAYSQRQMMQSFLAKLEHTKTKTDKTVDAAQLRVRLNLLRP